MDWSQLIFSNTHAFCDKSRLQNNEYRMNPDENKGRMRDYL